jgi:hypothetical protein
MTQEHGNGVYFDLAHWLAIGAVGSLEDQLCRVKS